MPFKVPPPPVKDKQLDSDQWGHWFDVVRANISNQSKFSALDFTGSNLTSIVTRNHNDLTALQGGTATQRYHLSLAEYNAVVSIPIEKSLFIDTTNQTLGAINTATAITFNSQPLTDGITIDAGKTKITVPTTGIYVVNFSAQITSTNAATKNLYFWPRVNGSDVTGSTMKQSIKDASYTQVISRTGVFSLTANDYLEAYWASDDINVQLTANAATAFCPATPSVTLSIYRIQN